MLCKFRGLTTYLKNGGTDASTRTTQIYERRREELSLDEVEKMGV